MSTTVRTSDFIISTPEISIYAIRTSFVNAVTAIFFPVMPFMLVLNHHHFPCHSLPPSSPHPARAIDWTSTIAGVSLLMVEFIQHPFHQIQSQV